MSKVAICLWLLSCAALCAAQDGNKKSLGQSKPDLSGTWVLDRSKSKLRNSELRNKGNVSVIVSHHEPEIRITRKLNFNGSELTKELIYYSDGRGEWNPVVFSTRLTDKDAVGTTTRWEKGKLLTKATYRSRSPQGVFEMDAFEKWELSSDGRALTETSWISPPRFSGQTTWNRNGPLLMPGPQGMILIPPVAPSTVKMVFTRVP